MRTKLLISFISIASLLLIQACSGSSGGGGGGTPAPDNGQSEAGITSLVLTVSGVDHTIGFDANREATVNYPYSTTALSNVIVKSIVLSADVTSDHYRGETIILTDDSKAVITVTAQDGTEQTYTINLVQAQPNTGADITSLVVTVSGTDHTIDFDTNREATVNYPYSTTALSNVIVKSISLSADATSDYGAGATIDVSNDQVTITVTAQDGTEQAYTISFTMAANTATDITSMVLVLNGTPKSIDFSATTTTTVEYQYSGNTAPATIQLTSIAMSYGAIAAIGDTTTDGGNNLPVDIAITGTNPSVSIVVTAQDGTSTQEYTVNITLTKVASNSLKYITDLDIRLSLGSTNFDHTNIAFSDETATVSTELPYGTSAADFPDSFTISNVVVSDGADASPDTGTVSITNSQGQRTATITVTAADDTTQVYTLIFTFTTADNTEANIDALVVTVSGDDHTIDFGDNRQASVDKPYSSSDLANVTIKSISLSADATATVGNANANNGATISLTDDYKATITVTAQDGTSNNTYSIFFVELKTLKHILDTTIGTSKVPADLSSYDELTQAVLAPYNANADIVARYITIDGGGAPQGGTSWSDALPRDQLKTVLDDTSGDATSDRVYLLLVASGATADASYDAGEAMQMQSHVAIIGGWDASGGWGRSSTTVLSGGDSHQVFNNSHSEANPLGSTALLYGLTIAAGRGTSGGGMLNSYSSPTLSNIIFSDNSVTFSGGGIYNLYSSPSMSNITFSGNSAQFDGGGMLNFYSSPTLSNITLSANSATSGGGIYNGNSSPSMSNITLSANSATGNGGGIHNQKSSPSMSNITLSANSADYGGGIYNNNSSPSMTNITLSANSATSGGGIYNSNSSPSMSNITLSANSAKNGGGMINISSSTTLTNITFSDNSADTGGGLYMSQRKATTIVGSIFWGNTSSTGAQIYIHEATGDPITLAYSVIAGGAPANITTSTNLVTTNPALSDLTTDTGSFVATRAISTGSSAINAGIYVRRLDYTDQSDDAQSRWYYSEDNNNWYTGFDSSGLTDSTSDTAATAEGSIDVTATDATGTARSDRPDAGAYEARQ